jgi:hypothetical protein
MYFFRFLFIVFCILILQACSLPSGEDLQDRPEIYFNLQGFVKEQIAYLQSTQAKVYKTALINEKKESKLLEQVDWQKELDAFVQADINKSAFEGMYLLQDSSAEGRLIKHYQAKSSSLHTQSLRIEIEESSNAVLAVEVRIENENYLYRTYQEMRLACERNAEGKNIVKHYRFLGRQKMIFSPERRFEIEGTVNPAPLSRLGLN